MLFCCKVSKLCPSVWGKSVQNGTILSISVRSYPKQPNSLAYFCGRILKIRTMKKVFFLLLTALMVTGHVCSQVISLADGFDHPQDSARTKLWWFFGETETTREGITADLEAFKQQGVGGVVYYDQVHGKGEGADKVFDSHWWQSLIFASQEAKRLGLSFEANIGNGYVAGGRWITPDRSMQRLAVSEGEARPASVSAELASRRGCSGRALQEGTAGRLASAECGSYGWRRPCTDFRFRHPVHRS